MAGEAKKVRAAQITISETIGALSQNSLSSVITGYNATQTGDYPDAEFCLKISYASAPTENSTVDLHVRPMNIKATDDASPLSVSYRPYFVCSFQLAAVTGEQILYATGKDLPKEGDFYLYTNATSNASSANAKLYMTPVTLGPT